VSEVQSHPATPGITARHIDKQRVPLRRAVREHIGIMRLTLRNYEGQGQTGQKTAKIECCAFHDLASGKPKPAGTIA
jgi:hypothetical protein